MNTHMLVTHDNQSVRQQRAAGGQGEAKKDALVYTKTLTKER